MVKTPSQAPENPNDLIKSATIIADAIKHKEASKKRFSRQNRRVLATGLMNFANLVFAGLVVGQGLAQKVDFIAMIIGAVGCLAMYYLAIRIMEKGSS